MHVYMNFLQSDNVLRLCAGGLTVLTANLVIAGYVVSAFGEEKLELTVEEKRRDNDASGPRVGAFKQRTD